MSMKSQLENCERDKDMLKAKLTASEEDLKIEMTQHKEVREELQRMKRKQKYFETQHAHEPRKREQGNGKLKERMQKILNDKYKGSNISLTLINPAPESPTLPTKFEISKEEDMYHQVLQDEEREREILAENQSLRLKGLLAMLKEEWNSRPAMVSVEKMQGREQEIREKDEEIDKQRKKIEDLLAQLGEKDVLLAQLGEKDVLLAQLGEEIDKQRKEIEDFLAQLEEKKFVSGEQDKVIDHFLSGNFFQGASEEVQLNMSGMELTIHEADEQTVSLRCMREQLDEERRQFTENTIKLGWDRVALRAERDAFEEEKRSLQTRAMLFGLEEMSSPISSNPRSQKNRTPISLHLSTQQTLITTSTTSGHSQYLKPALRAAVTSQEVKIADNDMFQSPSTEYVVRAVKHPRLGLTDENNIERRELITRRAKALAQIRVTRRRSVTSASMKENLSNGPSSTAEQRYASAKMQQLQMANAKFRATSAVSPSPAATSSRSLAAITSKAAASAVNSPRRPPARVAKLVSLAPHSHNTNTVMLHTSSNSSEEEDASSESATFVKRSTSAKRATSMKKAAAQAQAQAASRRSLRLITARAAIAAMTRNRKA